MKHENRVPVVVRSWNNRDTIEEVLIALRAQTVPVHIIAFDNDSEDGTREIVDRLADAVVRVPRGQYVPGRVLNEAMLRSRGDVVAFLNADCTPDGRDWLERLIAPFDEGSGGGRAEKVRVAATFSRQRPRPGCEPLEALDIERCYGDALDDRARHVFSMAASAVRRSAWAGFPFNAELRYSEDVHWTWRARQRGLRVVYVPESAVFHSHDYSLAQLYRRYRGEGQAEAEIFEWNIWRRSMLRYSVLPWGRQVLADWRHCLDHGLWWQALRSPLYRGVQAIGRRRGFCAGLASLSAVAGAPS